MLLQNKNYFMVVLQDDGRKQHIQLQMPCFKYCKLWRSV